MSRFSPLPALALFVLLGALLSVGSTSCDWFDSDDDPKPTATPTPTPTATASPTPTATPTPEGGAIDLNTAVFSEPRDANISGWAETATMTVSFDGAGNICLNHNKSNVWPTVNGVNVNSWVVVNLGGTWYAATFEWMRAGSMCKPMSTVQGNHIKVAPLDTWKPKSGEQLGFIVSGLARLGERSVAERSNVYITRWP